MNLKDYIKKIQSFFDNSLIKNILLTFGTIALFLTGIIVYGIILNLRQLTLQEAMEEKGFTRLKDINIVVDRKNYTLGVYEDTVLIKNYRASFGRNLFSKKKSSDDGATPVGNYKICDIQPEYKYYKFIKINYPNLEDATDALRTGILTQREFNQLKFEYYYSDCTSSDTELGGNIGIHGIGRLNFIFKNLPFVYNWTDGSIALSNEDIDELITTVKKGTQIVIK